jgi:hypothetical protein
MIRNRYRNYLSMNALVILGVICSFKFIPERQIAAVVASFLFLSSTGSILFFELRRGQWQKRFCFWAALLFLILSIVPIMYLRLSHWGENFQSLSLFGIAGEQMHKFSNWLFMTLMVSLFIDSQIEARRFAAEKMQKET